MKQGKLPGMLKKQRNLKDLCDEAFGVLTQQDSPAMQANTMLATIRRHKTALENIEADFRKESETLAKKYEKQTCGQREVVTFAEQSLVTLMKKERSYLFIGGDILYLENGSLIFNTKEKVSIPKNAVELCKEQKFFEVIKIAESVDRDAVEKWPDAKLLLIGAIRKTKETFGYELKVTRELARSAR
jgi:Bacteriophage Mu Gam like protein